jgi:hypothetical protein
MKIESAVFVFLGPGRQRRYARIVIARHGRAAPMPVRPGLRCRSAMRRAGSRVRDDDTAYGRVDDAEARGRSAGFAFYCVPQIVSASRKSDDSSGHRYPLPSDTIAARQ